MALESRTRGEGILIRLGPGPIITGAHYETITEFVNTENGQVVGGQANPLQSLDLAEGLPNLLGEVAAGALTQIEGLNQQVAGLAQQNQELTEQLQAALAEIERLTAAQAVEPEPVTE